MRFDRFGPIDSSEEAEKQYREMLRKLMLEQKFHLTMELTRLGNGQKDPVDAEIKARITGLRVD
jgi:hypothetical protein